MTDQNDEIIHYGIKGMRWGKRKSKSSVALINNDTGKSVDISYNPKKAVVTQKSDGTVNVKSTSKTEMRKIQSQIKTKSPKIMSDAQLRNAINRIQMEKQYSQLTAEKPSVMVSGKKAVQDILVNAAKQTATSYISKAMTKGVDAALKASAKK